MTENEEKPRSVGRSLRRLSSDINVDRFMLMEYLGPIVDGCRSALRVSVDKAKQLHNMSEDEFETFLEEQNISLEKLRKRYEEQIAIRKLHHYEVRGKIVVSPQDIENYYQEHIDDFTEKEKIKIKTIMVKKEGKDGIKESDKARVRIETIVDQNNEILAIIRTQLLSAKEMTQLKNVVGGGKFPMANIKHYFVFDATKTFTHKNVILKMELIPQNHEILSRRIVCPLKPPGKLNKKLRLLLKNQPEKDQDEKNMFLYLN